MEGSETKIAAMELAPFSLSLPKKAESWRMKLADGPLAHLFDLCDLSVYPSVLTLYSPPSSIHVRCTYSPHCFLIHVSGGACTIEATAETWARNQEWTWYMVTWMDMDNQWTWNLRTSQSFQCVAVGRSVGRPGR